MIEGGIAAAGSMFFAATIIMLPLTAFLLAINLVIGVMARSAPQLNLFSFGFPMTILGTFFALYFSVDALQFVFGELIDEAIGIVKIVLEDLGNG